MHKALRNASTQEVYKLSLWKPKGPQMLPKKTLNRKSISKSRLWNAWKMGENIPKKKITKQSVGRKSRIKYYKAYRVTSSYCFLNRFSAFFATLFLCFATDVLLFFSYSILTVQSKQ